MPKHRLLFLDFETYYDDEYSLRKLNPAEYILDPRYETIICAVKEDGCPSYIVDGPDFPNFIAMFDPATTTTVTFNSLFDNSILAWRYGFVPSLMLDTMGMARALRGHLLPSLSLEAVARHLGCGEKGHALIKMKGLHRDEIITEPHLLADFKAYAIQDVELNAAIYHKLIGEFPWAERRLMDLVLRCTIEPCFQVDVTMLQAHLTEVKKQKRELLNAVGVSRVDLMSSVKFQQALENYGVDVETKTTPTGNVIPAFAKTDGFMAELLDDEDPNVRALAMARLGFKSTIEETRAERLLTIAALPWPSAATMPIPLRYAGAHTLRLSGEWGMNMQNLPTERGSKGKSKLRKGLIAPPDHMVVVADLGQIEARLSAWFCGADALLTQFREKLDPYAKLAEAIFGYPVDRKVQILEGFIGKTGVLGLGYGAGWKKFYNMVLSKARVDGLDLGTMWTEELAKKTVKTYREVNSPMKDGWDKLGAMLQTAWLGAGDGPCEFGPVIICRGQIDLPNGMALNYADPHVDWDTNDLYFKYGKRGHKIYGAKTLENIIQALAYIVVMYAALRIFNKGYRFAWQNHDELVFIVHKDELDKAVEIIQVEMTRAPSWAPDLPLMVDIGVGRSYGEAK